jgi:hypothetical protein
METTPAHDRTTDGHERFVNIGASVKTRSLSAELVEQRHACSTT